MSRNLHPRGLTDHMRNVNLPSVGQGNEAQKRVDLGTRH